MSSGASPIFFLRHDGPGTALISHSEFLRLDSHLAFLGCSFGGASGSTEKLTAPACLSVLGGGEVIFFLSHLELNTSPVLSGRVCWTSPRRLFTLIIIFTQDLHSSDVVCSCLREAHMHKCKLPGGARPARGTGWGSGIIQPGQIKAMV